MLVNLRKTSVSLAMCLCMPVRPSVHMEQHGSQNPRLYLVIEIRRVSHGTCSYIFMCTNEVVNSVTLRL